MPSVERRGAEDAEVRRAYSFASFGLDTSLEPFTYSGSTYHNVVGIHEGTETPENIYIIGAHYDSTNSSDSGSGTGEIPGAPGADDNASGVAGILEAARVLTQSSFESDFNRDGTVDQNDLLAWQTGFGIAAGAIRADGDANGDGRADGIDFLLWQQQVGLETASGLEPRGVPEPTAILLALLGSSAWAGIYHRIRRRYRCAITPRTA